MRARSVFSPTEAASACICSGVTVKPQVRITWAADSTLPPRVASGALMAKYTPGSSTAAAHIAITATNDSMSIPP